ncbi:hypothetical protein TNCV_771911 [Trichonephila clavipes]|nr:hypothetical protein TNCV_771911 [Trichonephila clavipes]
MSIDFHYLTPMGGLEYGVKFMNPWILHARLELHKDMMAQSWSEVIFPDTVWDLCVVPDKLVANVAAIVGDHRCTRLAIESKRLWMCSWGTADQAASTRSKVDLVSQLGV